MPVDMLIKKFSLIIIITLNTFNMFINEYKKVYDLLIKISSNS